MDVYMHAFPPPSPTAKQNLEILHINLSYSDPFYTIDSGYVCF